MPSLGIDYSASRAYLAVVTDHKVNSLVSLQCEDPKTFLQMYQRTLFNFWSGHGIKNIYIEESWSKEGRYAWTGLKMEHMKTMLQAGALLCKAEEFSIDFVLPGVWRKAVYGTGRPENAKEYSISWVKENLNYEVPVMGKTGRGQRPDHNFAEAICIAVYGETRNKSV